MQPAPAVHMPGSHLRSSHYTYVRNSVAISPSFHFVPWGIQPNTHIHTDMHAPQLKFPPPSRSLWSRPLINVCAAYVCACILAEPRTQNSVKGGYAGGQEQG